MQNVIEAALNLRTQPGFDLAAVARVTIQRRGRGHSGPTPQSGLDGKFSAEYCAAAALLDGQVGIDSFTDARRFAPDLEQLLGKVQVDPEGPADGATRITAQLQDGATISAECSAFRGSAANPMAREEHRVKIRDCFNRALPSADTEPAIAMLENLEDLPDVGELMGILGQAAVGRDG